MQLFTEEESRDSHRRINSYKLSLTGRGRDGAGVKQLDFRIHVLNHHKIVYVSFKNIFTFILFLVNCKFM